MQATVTQATRRVLYTCDGRPSGCWVAGNTLHRVARASKHLLRRPPAWAFETGILKLAQQLGATQVEVTDAETGTTYVAPLARFWTQGIPLSRGWGEQVALTLNHWRRQQPEQMTLF